MERGRSTSRERDRKRQLSRSTSRDPHRDSPQPSRPKRNHSRDRHRRSASPHRRHTSRSPGSPKRSSHRRRRSRSRSASSSPDTDDDRERRKRRKEKRRHHSRSRSRSRDRDRKHKKKKDRKDKDKKKKKTAASTAQWGKYGIINESDIYNKEAEFRAYLVEELVVNPETISKDLNKKHFLRFVEEYNTATLPHEKYYALEPYERRMASLRNGEMVPQGGIGTYDPNADMAAHTSKHKRQVVESETYLSKEQLQELRQVQRDRVAIGKMKVLGQNIGSHLGVRMDGNQFE